MSLFTTKKTFKIKQTKKGKFSKGYKTVLFLVFGLPFTPKECLLDGVPVKSLKLGKKHVNGYGVRVPEGFKTLEFLKKTKN